MRAITPNNSHSIGDKKLYTAIIESLSEPSKQFLIMCLTMQIAFDSQTKSSSIGYRYYRNVTIASNALKDLNVNFSEVNLMIILP